jgi:BirA family biotin operon repressor/biotin-[acetyl-CoA-carboxylase] ligase
VLTEHIVAAAADAAGLPAPATYVETTGSTNADLMAAGDAGAPAWSVLVAGHQTAGRGRLGRTWEAPPGSSLLVSVLLRPSMSPEEAPLASLAAGVTTAEGIEAAANLTVALEWPNDLVTTTGRKLAGVLVDSRIEGNRLHHLVIGIGVNLTQSAAQFPDDVRLPPTSLTIEGAQPDPQALLEAILRRLVRWYDPRRAAFEPGILEAYRPRCATIGRRVRATTLDGAFVEGTATDIDSTGALLLETAVGEARVAFGEIERLD